MDIAIIGTGIAGLTVAHGLHRRHRVTMYEAADWIGGHTHTLDVTVQGRDYAVDTGFIVFNDRTYPNFVRLLDELGVASQPTTMSFSVRCPRTGLEYNGNNLNTLFAQRRNLLRPAFYAMLRDILRFNREAPRLLEHSETPTLGEYLRAHGYGSGFVEHYLVPMAAAIWSAEPARMLEMPAPNFIRFFRNHGLLSLNDRPQWRVIQGGSREYVKRLTAPFRDRIRLACPVRRVRRLPNRVELVTAAGTESYDQVVFATHSDQALGLLADPGRAERAVLGAIPYQDNSVVLHTDTGLLPRRRLAWAAWNYHLAGPPRQGATVTYNMNLLQGLDAPETFCVTLNHDHAIDPGRILARMHYQHPLFTPAAVAAQARHGEINGVNRTWYCGAYWGNGFHEDGVVSALRVVEGLGAEERLAA